MDLSQTKLSKSEWNSIEVSVSDSEKRILQMILDGYADVSICSNTTTTLISHIKIPPSAEMDWFLYQQHFEPMIQEWMNPTTAKETKTSKSTKPVATKSRQEPHPILGDIRAWQKSLVSLKCKPPSKADMIRIQNTMQTIHSNRHAIFEFLLMDFCKYIFQGNSGRHPWFYLYSFIQFKKSTIPHLNRYVQALVDLFVKHYAPSNADSIAHVFHHARDYIEKNAYLIQYEDMGLYPHQKQLFQLFQSAPNTPKLVLYMAPTGTGKTLSPIGLSCGYRVIFVCVARHVGLALAKSAISVGKRVAFAFGCETASDIRLHYFAATEYKINKRSGGIGKVDNSVGDKVEIMICDVASYLTAMHYMLAFHDETRIVTYWDEPTITMDYETHDLHATIHRNWAENKISKLVLSCATLPKEEEIAETLHDFRQRFSRRAYDDDDADDEDADETPHAVYGYQASPEETVERIPAEVHTIDSYDCKKTIAMVNKEGYSILPHALFDQYRDILRCVDHCENNKTLLRYFDVQEIVRFVEFVQERGWLAAEYHPAVYFKHVGDIQMKSLKLYYLQVLRNIDPENWPEIHRYMQHTMTSRFSNPVPSGAAGIRKIQSVDPSYWMGGGGGGRPLERIGSVAAPPQGGAAAASAASTGILLTTKDAHTLTDGPTIFLADDVDKIGKFYIQQTNFPESVFASILEKIERNNVIQKTMNVLEKQLDDRISANAVDDAKGKKGERTRMDKESMVLMEQIATLRETIQSVHLPAMFIPNTKPHQDVWLPEGVAAPNAFVPRVDETDVREIMALNVDNQKKMLLILGIGVFSMNNQLEYMEIMKRLAYEQRLFLIIASSDYIYGTNYQFCHGLIGKDLQNMTQQKTIQAIGRIGRNHIQQEYSVRFRDDRILTNLFQTPEINLEAHVMKRLFVSR